MATNITRLGVGEAPSIHIQGGGPGLDVINVADASKEAATKVTTEIERIQANTNQSETEKMMDMQIASIVFNAITTSRTNLIKMVGDALKQIVRNTG